MSRAATRWRNLRSRADVFRLQRRMPQRDERVSHLPLILLIPMLAEQRFLQERKALIQKTEAVLHRRICIVVGAKPKGAHRHTARGDSRQSGLKACDNSNDVAVGMR